MHPFQWIPPSMRKTLILPLGLCAGLLGLWMLVMNLRLHTSAAPDGMFDLELSRTAERFDAIVASWWEAPAFPDRSSTPADAVRGVSSEKLDTAQQMQIGGFILALAYSLTISMGCAWLAPWSRFPALVMTAAWTAMVAGLADALENFLILHLFHDRTATELLTNLYVFSSVKSVLLAFSMGVLAWMLQATGRRFLAWSTWVALLALLVQFLGALHRSQ